MLENVRVFEDVELGFIFVPKHWSDEVRRPLEVHGSMRNLERLIHLTGIDQSAS